MGDDWESMKICRKCGTTMPDEMKYCVRCGAVLDGAAITSSEEKKDKQENTRLTIGIASAASIVIVGLLFLCIFVFGNPPKYYLASGNKEAEKSQDTGKKDTAKEGKNANAGQLSFSADTYEVEINKDIGECLLAGIITDTGGFKYEGVTTETFEFVASLLRIGVNVSEIYKKVLQVKTRAHFELTKIAIDRMEFFEDGKIAFTYITLKDIEDTQAEAGDHEGLVEIGRDLEGVEVSILLRETEKGYKASLRSKEYVNVSEICSIFSGGGHQRAAGCTIPYALDQAKEKIIDRTKTFLK